MQTYGRSDNRDKSTMTRGTITDRLVPIRVSATLDPTVTDDEDAGIILNHLWKRTDTDDLFECIDITAGAAVWVPYNRLEVNAQVGTTYTLVLGDKSKIVECTNAGAIVLTVPKDDTVAYPIGSVIPVSQGGAGAITITPATDVTIHSEGTLTDTNGQYAEVFLRYKGSNNWSLTGNRA